MKTEEHIVSQLSLAPDQVELLTQIQQSHVLMKCDTERQQAYLSVRVAIPRWTS